MSFFRNKEPKTFELRYRTVTTIFGKEKKIPIPKNEQRKAKAKILASYPDAVIFDDLGDEKIKPYDDDWIDQLEMLDAIFDD